MVLISSLVLLPSDYNKYELQYNKSIDLLYRRITFKSVSLNDHYYLRKCKSRTVLRDDCIQIVWCVERIKEMQRRSRREVYLFGRFGAHRGMANDICSIIESFCVDTKTRRTKQINAEELEQIAMHLDIVYDKENLYCGTLPLREELEKLFLF